MARSTSSSTLHLPLPLLVQTTNETCVHLRVGAGTGIFTRALLSHPAWASSELPGGIKALRAVEPSAGMRTVFERSLPKEYAAKVSVREGTFDRSGVQEDGWADVVVIAQAFHWCQDLDAACAEFARVLKPGGVLCLVWNVEDTDAAPWAAHLRALYERYESSSIPGWHLGHWRAFSSTPSYVSAFSSPLSSAKEQPEERAWPNAVPATAELVRERALSKSYVAVLPADEKASVETEVRWIVEEEGEGKVWLDREGGVFEYPYKTVLVAARRK